MNTQNRLECERDIWEIRSLPVAIEELGRGKTQGLQHRLKVGNAQRAFETRRLAAQSTHSGDVSRLRHFVSRISLSLVRAFLGRMQKLTMTVMRVRWDLLMKREASNSLNNGEHNRRRTLLADRFYQRSYNSAKHRHLISLSSDAGAIQQKTKQALYDKIQIVIGLLATHESENDVAIKDKSHVD